MQIFNYIISRYMTLFVFGLDMFQQHILYWKVISSLPTVEVHLSIMNTSDVTHQLWLPLKGLVTVLAFQNLHGVHLFYLFIMLSFFMIYESIHFIMTFITLIICMQFLNTFMGNLLIHLASGLVLYLKLLHTFCYLPLWKLSSNQKVPGWAEFQLI